MTQPPLVSVITPAYNAAATLERAHQSVLAQRGRWEHIIVDDGSTDDTPRILASLAADPRVIAMSQPNGGSSSALNSGLARAQGDYIAFLDADDEYGDQHLEARLSFLESQPKIDLLWGGLTVISDNPADAFVPDVVKGTGYIAVTECVVQGTIFARRCVFDQLRFTTDRSIWYQDYELVERARALFVVEQFLQPTYRYYRNSGTSIVDTVKRTWPVGASNASA